MGTMEKRPCARGCGRMLDPRGAHKHEATCGGSAKRAAGPSARLRAVSRSKGRRGTRATRRGPKAARKSKITNHQSQIAEGCLFCGGPNQALARDLVERMIRGGMGYDVAAGTVRDVLALVGR